jgi:hypothetical protein
VKPRLVKPTKALRRTAFFHRLQSVTRGIGDSQTGHRLRLHFAYSRQQAAAARRHSLARVCTAAARPGPAARRTEVPAVRRPRPGGGQSSRPAAAGGRTSLAFGAWARQPAVVGHLATGKAAAGQARRSRGPRSQEEAVSRTS